MKKRNVYGFLLSIILFILLGSFLSHATGIEIKDAKDKKTVLEKEREKTKRLLEDFNRHKLNLADYMKKLDDELYKLNEELDELNQKISDKELDIELKKEDLKNIEDISRKQYESMKLRIQYMYERGETNIIDLLLESKNPTELLNRAEYIYRISEYDRKKLDEYEEVRNQINIAKNELEKEHENLVEIKNETDAKKESVNSLLKNKRDELSAYNKKIEDTKSELSEYDKQIRAQEATIRAIEAEIKRKEEAARKAALAAGNSYKTISLGDIRFIWPCPSSSRITSGFGVRVSPVEGASSNHMGIDIGAKTGSKIVASADGDVIISSYSAASGNYIMLNHGSGIYTVYLHCNSLTVSAGEHVKAGQQIATVGSTGYSTGPHLHFGIRVGGKYVNPSLYVSP